MRTQAVNSVICAFFPISLIWTGREKGREKRQIDCPASPVCFWAGSYATRLGVSGRGGWEDGDSLVRGRKQGRREGGSVSVNSRKKECWAETALYLDQEETHEEIINSIYWSHFNSVDLKQLTYLAVALAGSHWGISSQKPSIRFPSSRDIWMLTIRFSSYSQDVSTWYKM